MHAAVELADEVDAGALIVPTSTGGTLRACAKYRHRRPIIALAHEPRRRRTSSRSSGASTPTTMAAAETVDELIDSALEHARDFAGLEPGAARS